MTGAQMAPSIAVVLPAHNEAENIAGMLQDVINTVGVRTADYEIIVVADGSQDRTPEIVMEAAARQPRIRLLRHATNQGYGAAVYDGLAAATKELVFLTDADRQFDLREFDKLLEALGGCDLAIGYRAPRRDPLLRTLNGWGWSACVTLLFGYVSRDIDCAFKLLRRGVIQELKDRIRSRGATFSAELLVRAKRAGYRIREVPIHGHRPRMAGRPSGGRPDVILRAFKELLLFRLRLWREGRPIRARA